MHALDDPAWGSLTGVHAALGFRSGRAVRYPADVRPFAGVAALDDGALRDLTQLVPEGDYVAMGGERLRPAGHAEVSGVCTASDARGGGLAEAVVRAVASQIQARGDLPFLHVQVGSASQATATARYERLGFRERPGAGGER